ncbi:hypothetical protein O6H91_18G083000 [Diphasiastrum complanatum]|nr:hypothetical protein O6H91_18G083000 [Diphasiastrum complanatum]
MKSSHQLSTLFEKVDMNILLFDIQDVGARFYTFIWTLYDCMVAVAMASKHIKMVVADRPNPVGGAIIDGPLLNDFFSSFVGRKAILLRHGMTIGEIAQLFNAEFVAVDAGKQVELEVLCMKGWERTMIFSETGLLWVPPSPNMPSPTAAAFYLGTALFEGTNCSEGRGTTLPFEMIGAPWLDYHLISDLQQEDCPGALFREAWFTPSFSKFSGKLINGIQVHLCDVAKFNSLRTALTILSSIIKLYPHNFEWRKDGSLYWIDKLVGNTSVREDLSKGASADEVIATWQDDILWFGAMRQKYLLY